MSSAISGSGSLVHAGSGTTVLTGNNTYAGPLTRGVADAALMHDVLKGPSDRDPWTLSGGVQVMSNLTLPYNRIAIIVFAALVLLGMTLLIGKTRLGLFVRSVTQNRPMASCMGVNTARVDTMAFSLGAGIAGLAGCALSQIGNVGPDLGQNYIVDSFMVVVTGGVGQLAGTVYAALGLGLINKVLEGWSGAVLAKIMVLVIVVIFIQKRPQGLFAFKGREA